MVGEHENVGLKIDKSKINKNEGYLEVQDEKHHKQVIQEKILHI